MKTSAATGSREKRARVPLAARRGWLSAIAIVLASPLALPLLTSASLSVQTSEQSTARPIAEPGRQSSSSPSAAAASSTGLHQWGAVTLFHGLPSDRVHAIAQGPDGAMWFGTEAGLARFDGRRTQTIVIDGLAPGRVLALQTGADGALWIGTETGAARMHAGRFGVLSEIAGHAISAIITPERGRALLASEQGNIFECRIQDLGTRQTQPLLTQQLQSADRTNPGPLIITSLMMVQNTLYAGSFSRGLLAIVDGQAREIETRPATYFVQALEAQPNGKLWLGARVRRSEPALLTGWETSKLVRDATSTGTVTSIRTIGKDVWVATDGAGVFRFAEGKEPQRYTFDGTAGGLRSDRVYSIFEDREAVIWFGTDRGVCRFDPNAVRSESIGDSPESNFVRALYQTSAGQLLAGTNRGLFVHDASSSAWRPVRGLEGNIIYSIVEDNQGRLLVGSASGFFAGERSLRDSNIETGSFSKIETGSGNVDAVGSIRAIIEFRGSTYVAIYGQGVARYEGDRLANLWGPNLAVARDVISLFADGDRRLLVGSGSDGVLVFDGSEVKRDPAFAKLAGSSVRSILSTPDNTLWFATNRGVYVCRANSECMLTAAGIEARALARDPESNRNEVWCASSGNGLLKIRLGDTEGKAGENRQAWAVVSEIDVEQGLPSQNVFAVRPEALPDGSERVIIGTGRGIARYNASRTLPTLYATRVVSRRVHAPGELATGLRLEYPQNSLLLDVAAISSRTYPEQFQYAFALVDAKGAVIKQRLSRESQFAMEGLGAGKYRVTARAFSKDLIASEPLSFEFAVAKAPFPWTSTALAILLAMALLALAWVMLARRRIARTSAALLDANRELADARLNLANEAERERRRIARDLHDQTLADLRHLQLLTDKLPEGIGGGGGEQPAPAALRQEIESISQEVRRICEDLSPSVLQNVGFAAALEFAVSHALNDAPAAQRLEFEYSCDDDLEERADLPANVQMQIYRIVQEAVNNILRHAGATQVKMDVRASSDDGFILTLEDNGRAFDPEPNNRGRGLANMLARASLIDAQLSWNERDGGGTVFRLQLNRQN